MLNKLTFKELNNIIEKYNIPKDVILMSDSGWECFATDMLGIYYNKTKNTIVFTQYFFNNPLYPNEEGWEKLYSDNIGQDYDDVMKI